MFVLLQRSKNQLQRFRFNQRIKEAAERLEMLNCCSFMTNGSEIHYHSVLVVFGIQMHLNEIHLHRNENISTNRQVELEGIK